MPDCTFYLIALPSDLTAAHFIRKIRPTDFLIRGIPHGWVLQPHAEEAKALVSAEWSLFLLTHGPSETIDHLIQDHAVASITSTVSIPQAQYDELVSNTNKPATPSKATPPLPSEWNDRRIPVRHILPPKPTPPAPGELKLYEPLATFLSNTLPRPIRDKPVSLFNLFKYHDGDSTVHEHYMQGFKEKFGPAAGAQLKFMGPVVVPASSGDGLGGMGWQDANLVQYDSVLHYAYMLSTDAYAELNAEKVAGLEDTCILMISEVELEDV